MYFNKNTKCIILRTANSLVHEDKKLMITTVHFAGVNGTWKGQVRFFRFMDQPNTINIENNKIGVLLEMSSHELYSQGIRSIIDNH
jgi:hypothetical protein